MQSNPKPSVARQPTTFKTPDTSKMMPQPSINSAQKSSFKRTPPMCQCGKRSKFCTVQSPGPNQGRSFYACSRGRYAQDKCKFFLWENQGQSPKLDGKAAATATKATPRLKDISNVSPAKRISCSSRVTTTTTTTPPNAFQTINKSSSSMSHFKTSNTPPAPPSQRSGQKQYFGNVQLFRPQNLTDLGQSYLQ